MDFVVEFLVKVVGGEVQMEGRGPLSDPTHPRMPPLGPLKLLIFGLILV